MKFAGVFIKFDCRELCLKKKLLETPPAEKGAKVATNSLDENKAQDNDGNESATEKKQTELVESENKNKDAPKGQERQVDPVVQTTEATEPDENPKTVNESSGCNSNDDESKILKEANKS